MVIYCWGRRGQDFIFSWPVRFPFAILHLDVWMLEYHIDSNGNIALMNSMCDTSQFVVVVHIHDEASATLADHFVQHVLIKFCICYLVVLDDDTPFKEAFIIMRQSLNLNYDVLAKRNYKGLSVEHFHRF